MVAQMVKNLPAVQETRFNSWIRKICWRRDRLPTPLFLGFPGGSAGKKSACNVRDLGLIPELGKSPGEGKGYLLRYSGLENSIDCICHGVAKSQTQLRNFHFHNHCKHPNTTLSLPVLWDLPDFSRVSLVSKHKTAYISKCLEIFSLW